MTTKTLQQQIVQTEQKLTRLRQREKAKDTRRKIIVGALVIREAMSNPAAARKLTGMISTGVTRDVDKADIASLIDELNRVQAQTPATPPEISGHVET